MEEISKKNRNNSRKDNEINLLKAQLAKFKKYLKNGEFDKINNEPDIEIKGDEESSDLTGVNEGIGDSTAKTGFYENKENIFNKALNNIDKRDKLIRVDTYYKVSLLKKLLHDIPRVRVLDFLNKYRK